MNKLAKCFLIINAVILLGYAIIFLIRPATLGRIVGFTQHSPNTFVEVMGFYGGFEFGLASFFIWGAFHESRLKPALTAFILIFLSAGAARLAGIIQYGFNGPSQVIVSAIEISFSVFALWLRNKIIPSGK